MRVAWFSALYDNDIVGLSSVGMRCTARGSVARDESLSCYVSHLLLPELAKSCAIDIYHDGPAARFVSNDCDLPVFNYLNAAIRADHEPYDVYLYQVEDSPVSGFCRHHLGLKPGIVWFHQVLLEQRAPDPLSHSPWEYLISAARADKFELPSEDVWPETNDPYPWRETSLAFGCLFSQEWAHGEYLRRRQSGLRDALVGKRLKDVDLPNLHMGSSSFLPLPLRVAQLAESKRAASGRLRIGLLGSVGAESRYHKLLAALAETQLECEIIWFVKAAEVPQAQAVFQLYPEFRCQVEAIGSPALFSRKLLDLDVVVAMRYSLYGNPSPWMDLAIAAEVPTIVADFGFSAYRSSSECFKLHLGAQEVSELGSVLSSLAKGTGSADLVNVSACREFRLERSASEIALELRQYLEANRELLSLLNAGWQQIEQASVAWVEQNLVS